MVLILVVFQGCAKGAKFGAMVLGGAAQNQTGINPAEQAMRSKTETRSGYTFYAYCPLELKKCMEQGENTCPGGYDMERPNPNLNLEKPMADAMVITCK